MKTILTSTIPVFALLVLALPLSSSAQEDEDSRSDRLRRIEQALERLERALSEQLEERELIPQIEGQLQLFDEGGGALLDERLLVQAGRFVIGVQVTTGEEFKGIVVESVINESPAAEAGIRAGDMIVAAGDAQVSTLEELAKAVQESGGEPLAIAIVRGDETIEIEVTPEERRLELFSPENLPEGFEQRLIPHAELQERLQDLDLEFDPDMLEHLERQFIPRLLERGRENDSQKSLRAELDELRQQLDEQRAMMEEMRAAIKELSERIKDRD